MDGLEALQAGCSAESEDISCRTVSRGMGVAFRPGADVDAAISRLAEIDGRFEAFPLPSVVNNLEQIGSTPWLLAAFLAMMGLGGLAHALVVGSARRARYLAITRAMGLRPRQAGGAVHWQAVALAVAGAAAGLVLGAIAGRLIWRRVAEGIGAMVEIVVPLQAVAAAVAVALAAAVVVAVVPALRAARMRPAEILRTE
jgi:putative ABC transport system permease protein